MIKALKKNQIIIFAIALMLITAGYLNYSMKTEQTAEVWSNATTEQIAGIGDAKLVSSNNVTQENSINSDTVNENTQISTQGSIVENEDTNKEETEKDKNVSQTSAKAVESNDKYFSESKLEREKMYSEMLESYQTMLASNSISSEQRNNAQNEVSKINSQKNAIMIAENLIKNKGFNDIVIFVNNESVSVVVDSEKLEEADIAQIQSIIQRELSVNVENIHISNK